MSFWKGSGGSLLGSLGGVASSALGVFGGMMGNAASAKEARKQRDWLERMSNTAHQREVKDLRAAGLNPILSGFGGSGATVSGGASAQQSNIFEGVGDNFFSAKRFSEIEKEQLEIERELKDSSTDLNRASAELASEQKKLAMVNQNVSSAQASKMIQDTDTSRMLAQAYGAQSYRDFTQGQANTAQKLNIDADTALKVVDKFARPGRFVQPVLNFLESEFGDAYRSTQATRRKIEKQRRTPGAPFIGVEGTPPMYKKNGRWYYHHNNKPAK